MSCAPTTVVYLPKNGCKINWYKNPQNWKGYSVLFTKNEAVDQMIIHLVKYHSQRKQTYVLFP